MLKQTIKTIGLIAASSALVWAGFSALPATAADYSAEKIIESEPKTDVRSLERYNYRIGFKNTGTETWTNSGQNKVTIKTTENVRIEHWFYSRQWIDKTTVANLHKATVEPGDLGIFNLQLEAPTRAGTYTNRFAIFIGNKKLSGTDFEVVLRVNGSSSKVTTTNAAYETIGNTNAPAETVNNEEEVKLKENEIVTGKVLITSKTPNTLTPGETINYRVGIKNNGQRNWRDAEPSKIELKVDTSKTVEDFNDGSWKTSGVVTVLNRALVKPGELAILDFKIQAPETGGTYDAAFRLVMNGDTLVKGSEFTVPITVSEPTPEPTLTPNFAVGNSVVCIAAQEPDNASTNGACNPPHNEPRLRVGIQKLDEQHLGVTANSTYVIKDVTGRVYRTISPGEVAYLSYEKATKEYIAAGVGAPIRSPYAIKVEAIEEPSIITLTTFNNPVAYNRNLNDNIYRGAIELRWSENDEATWIINEIMMEEYLKGLAEFSSSSPSEYQKALIVAARTYALYHMQTGIKHAKRHFHVVATVSDQYYRGYASEQRIKTVVDAVENTRGQVVTYEGDVVVTPYSASTSGVSRTWNEVWGGTDKPWLIKQTVPHDVGRKRFGHGVGLSQLAAADMARDGLEYVDILKFFYVGTEVGQWYN